MIEIKIQIQQGSDKQVIDGQVCSSVLCTIETASEDNTKREKQLCGQIVKVLKAALLGPIAKGTVLTQMTEQDAG